MSLAEHSLSHPVLSHAPKAARLANRASAASENCLDLFVDSFESYLARTVAESFPKQVNDIRAKNRHQ
jgi:hypothetical protein